nr:MAG TPA: MerR HTH family regulatory protein [Caudoviricetes sp.]
MELRAQQRRRFTMGCSKSAIARWQKLQVVSPPPSKVEKYFC